MASDRGGAPKGWRDRWLTLLSRKTSTGRFIPAVDGLRFISIALVVATHLRYFLDKSTGAPYAGHLRGDTLADALGRGQYGVQFFFAISGFILALPFAAQHMRGAPPVGLGKYFLRRLTRLEPPYILVLTAMLLVRIVTHHEGLGVGELVEHYLASLGYSHHLVYGATPVVLHVTWSLEIEVQFYILAPLLARVFLIPSVHLRRGVIVGVGVAALLLQTLVLDRGSVLHLTLLGHIQHFAVGFLLADLFLVEWREAPARTFLWDVPAALALVVFLVYPFAKMRELMWTLPVIVGVVFIAAFRGRVFHAVLSQPVVATIGGMCYTTYLIHAPIITFVGTAIGKVLGWGRSFVADLALLSVIVLPVILVASVVFFLLVERPCMEKDWPQRLWKRLRGGLSAARPR